MTSFEVFLLGQPIRDDHVRGKAVVVIDVLRACSTIVTALANGARTVIPIADVGEAGRLASNLDASAYVLGGERDALPIPDFPLGNSPREFTPEVVGGRTVILHSTNGAPVFPAAASAEAVVAGCLLNVSAVEHFLREAGQEAVLVCAGWKGRVSLEDTLCAGLLFHRLCNGHCPDDASDAARLAFSLYETERHDLEGALARSQHGRRLAELGHSDDVRDCARLDHYGDLLPRYDGSGLRLAAPPRPV
jgi:2-phosphosulfolactate phosphatase